MGSNARTIARIVGPTCVAIAVTEWLNMDAFAQQTAPVIYLNGTLLFVGGVAILQAHGRWRREWAVLVTLVGWASVALGLYRMAVPSGPQAAAGPATNVVLAVLGMLGLFLTAKGYSVARTGEGASWG